MRYVVILFFAFGFIFNLTAQQCDTLEIKEENRQAISLMFFQLARDTQNTFLDYKGNEIGVDTTFLDYVGIQPVYIEHHKTWWRTYNLLPTVDTYYFCFKNDALFKLGALRNVYDDVTGELRGQDFIGWIILKD